MKAILVVVLVGCAAIDSSPRTAMDVPPAVTATVRNHAGAADYKVHRDGDDRFEASWREGDLEREAVVARDGKLVELEIEMRAEDVPVAVRDTAQRVLGARSIIKYVKLTSDRYEVETIVNGREREIMISGSGTIVGGDDDGDDDDGDDDDGEQHE